jgi:IS30 family transposase
MANALKNTVTDMPALLWQSLTWDRGKELSDHARFTVESGIKVFFADSHSPWQRGQTKIRRSPAAVLPKGYRLVSMERSRNPGRCQCTEF